jgi:hypothetical protein
MGNEYEIFILPDGTVKFLYYDELKPLLSIGTGTTVRRVSHVDPEITGDGLKWFADLSPMDGPKLGPFETRQLAIDAEIKWWSANQLKK